MKSTKIVFLFLVVFLALSSIFLLQRTKADVVKSKYFNYVEKGAKVVKTSPSTQYKLMETYPQATITVYEAGTTNLANIWSDKDGFIIKANPFTADTDSFFYFYVDCGKYDIKFSGTGILTPYTWGDVSICGTISSGTGNVSTLGGTTDFIPKWASSTSLGDSVIYNPSNLQIASTVLFGWTNGAATSSLDVAFGRNTTGKVEINNGTLGVLRDLTLHRIEPIPTVTIPGLNFGPIATDPTLPVVGDCWYNTTSNQFKCFNGSIVILSTGSGITSINGLTASAQLLVVGTSGSDFNIASSIATHTFNLPDAGFSARGVVNTGSQTFNGDKTFDDTVAISSNTANSFIYSNSLKRIITTSAPVNGQLLIGSTGTAPVVGNITGDSNISIINSAGGIQITCVSCGSGGGTLINPTDNRLPYRQNATTFGDSPLYRETANILRQENGTNIQFFDIYRSFTDATTFTKLRIGYETTTNNFFIATQAFVSGIQTNIGTNTNGLSLVLGAKTLFFFPDGRVIPLGSTMQLGEFGNSFTEVWANNHFVGETGFIRFILKGKIQSPVDGIISTTDSLGNPASFISPAEGRDISADTNDLDIFGGEYLRLTVGAGGKNLTGLRDYNVAVGTGGTDGQRILLINVDSTDTLTIKHEDTGSAAGNRFKTSTAADVSLAPNQAADLIYDGSVTRWRVYKRN